MYHWPLDHLESVCHSSFQHTPPLTTKFFLSAIMSAWHNIAGSTTAGCISTVLGHPLDTIKVFQQTQPHLYRHGTIHVAKSLGASQLFKGIGPPMMNQIIMNTIMFSVFRNVKDVMSSNNLMDENASAMCAGLISGFSIACLSTPMDWIKIQAQLSQSTKHDNSLMLMRQLMRNHQNRLSKIIPVMYRGHVANLCREGVFTMVYLGLYDRISSIVKENGEQGGQPLHMGQVVLISSFTGACAWICNYPFDTLKTVMQGKGAHESIPMKTAFLSIWNSGGAKAFFRGVKTSTGRAMLVTSTRMLVYEKTIQLLREK